LLQREIANQAASAIKLENKLEKKLSSAKAYSLKVSNTLTTRAVRFATALSDEKEKTKALKRASKATNDDIEKVIRVTAKTHKFNIKAQQQNHKIKLVNKVGKFKEECCSVIGKVKEECCSVILNGQEEFDEAAVNAKGKSRRNVILGKTKGEEKIRRSQRACAGPRSKLNVRIQLYSILIHDSTILPFLYTNLPIIFKCQSKHTQEIRELDREHKAKEAMYLKDKQNTDKSLVILNDTLSKKNKVLGMMEADQSYCVIIAVNHARRSERCHYTSVVQVQKDLVQTKKGKGVTLKSASMVSHIL